MRSFIALITCLLCLTEPAAAGLARVSVREESVVVGERIALGDIADITGTQKAAAALAAIELGRAPSPGLERRLKREKILSLIAARGFSRREVAVDSPDEARVIRASQNVSREAIEKALVDHLMQATGAAAGEVVIKVLGYPKIALPLGALELRVERSGWLPAAERAFIPVTFFVDGKKSRAAMVEALVEVWGRVAVARKLIRPGEPINNDDFSVEARRLASLPRDAVSDPDLLEGKIARRAIEAGRVIRTSAIESPVLVKRGDTVTVIAEGEKFELRAKAKAKGTGKYGDYLRLIVPESGVEIYGRVTGEKEVSVKF